MTSLIHSSMTGQGRGGFFSRTYLGRYLGNPPQQYKIYFLFCIYVLLRCQSIGQSVSQPARQSARQAPNQALSRALQLQTASDTVAVINKTLPYRFVR